MSSGIEGEFKQLEAKGALNKIKEEFEIKEIVGKKLFI